MSSFQKMFPYHLVEFVSAGRRPKLRKIDVVATKWITYDIQKKKCFVKYPPPPYTTEAEKVIDKALKNLEDAPATWMQYHAKIKGKAMTFIEALSKLEQLKYDECVLTLESDETSIEAEARATTNILKQNLEKVQAQLIEEFEKENFNSYNETNEGYNNTSTTSVHIFNQSENLKYSTNTQTSSSPPTNSFSKTIVRNYEEVVLEGIADIKTELKELRLTVYSLVGKFSALENITLKNQIVDKKEFISSVQQINKIFNYSIPFTSLEDFQTFDQQLSQNHQLETAVCNVLQTAIDSSLIISRSIVNMLKMFLCKEVAMQFLAIKKKPNNYVMYSTAFFKCIDRLIKERRKMVLMPTSDKDIISALSSVLCNAPSWYVSRK